MALTYRQWLNKSYGKGAQSNATRGAAYRRLNPKPVKPTTPKPAPTPNPKFTPGALDEEGVVNRQNITRDYDLGRRGIETDYTDTVAGLDAQIPQINRDRDLGYQSVDNNAAARGLFRSGIRQLNRTKVGEQTDDALRQVSLARQRAATRKQQQLDLASSDYQSGTSQNEIGSNARQFSNFIEQTGPGIVNPANVPGAEPVKVKPAVDYKTFLKGRRSTLALAKQWDKLYNFGQRFG